MTTVEENPVFMDGGPLSQEELDTLVHAVRYQKVALQRCYSDYLYWRSNHGAVHYAARTRRRKSWKHLAPRSIAQSLIENA